MQRIVITFLLLVISIGVSGQYVTSICGASEKFTGLNNYIKTEIQKEVPNARVGLDFNVSLFEQTVDIPVIEVELYSYGPSEVGDSIVGDALIYIFDKEDESFVKDYFSDNADYEEEVQIKFIQSETAAVVILYYPDETLKIKPKIKIEDCIGWIEHYFITEFDAFNTGKKLAHNFLHAREAVMELNDSLPSPWEFWYVETYPNPEISMLPSIEVGFSLPDSTTNNKQTHLGLFIFELKDEAIIMDFAERVFDEEDDTYYIKTKTSLIMVSTNPIESDQDKQNIVVLKAYLEQFFKTHFEEF